MEVLIIILGLFFFAFFNTLVFLVAFFNKNRKVFNINYMFLSSVFLVISLFLLFLDMRVILDGGTNLFFTFTNFFFLALSCTLSAKSITDLYDIESRVPLKLNVLFAFLAGSLGAFATYIESYNLRGLTFTVIIVVMVAFIIHYLTKLKVKLVRNIYFYQSLFIVLFLASDFIRVVSRKETFTFANADMYDILFTSLIVIILITMHSSYLTELHKGDIAQLEKKNYLLEYQIDKVKEISETDVLTGLWNRRKVMQVLEVWQELYRKNDVGFSVILCDINDFKNINDSYGHATGDEALKFISDILLQTTRNNDVIGRWGGDEFIILLHQAGYSQAKVVEEKIHQTINNSLFKTTESYLSLSTGIETVISDTSIRDIIASADAKMYYMKEEYRKNKK